MPTTELFPDVMGDLKTWLKSVTTDLLDGRVFFRFPTTMGYPAVRIYEAGGGPQPDSEAPLEDVRIVFDIWGKPTSGPNTTGDGTYADVVAVQRRLKTQLHDLHGPIGSGATYVLNADVTSSVRGTDPDGGSARLIVTALLTVRNS